LLQKIQFGKTEDYTAGFVYGASKNLAARGAIKSGGKSFSDEAQLLAVPSPPWGRGNGKQLRFVSSTFNCTLRTP
jgi:hypothetical protein